jgi:hypothetical protein
MAKEHQTLSRNMVLGSEPDKGKQKESIVEAEAQLLWSHGMPGAHKSARTAWPKACPPLFAGLDPSLTTPAYVAVSSASKMLRQHICIDGASWLPPTKAGDLNLEVTDISMCVQSFSKAMPSNLR